MSKPKANLKHLKTNTVLKRRSTKRKLGRHFNKETAARSIGNIEKGTPINEKAAAMVIETAKVHPLLMELDFEDREDLYQAICKAAKEELRTPENQLMWWIMNTDPDKMRKGLAGE